jgi:hypothetical protein
VEVSVETVNQIPEETQQSNATETVNQDPKADDRRAKDIRKYIRLQEP